MDTSLLDTRCVTCEHEVVRGVACDWQPDYCPLSHDQTLVSGTHESIGELLAIAGEYDAVRSEN